MNRRARLILTVVTTACCFQAAILSAQSIHHFDGKWAFTGLRTTIFKVENEKLFVGMIEYTDTSNFNRFLRQLPLDSNVYREGSVTKNGDTFVIKAKFSSIDHELNLLYTDRDSNTIWFTGDVYFDSSKMITANTNCSLSNPACINRLHNQNDLKLIMKLKTSDTFTRDDAFEFLTRLNGILKSRCNKCYAGFTDAYMNEIFIEMGFNPMIKRAAAGSVWYNTSGFTFYIKNKFSDDARIVKLSDYIFDCYLK